MFSKLAFLCVIAVATAAPQHAAQYPAGVDPQRCPNFPICDNAALHNPQSQWQQPQAHWNQPQQWQQPQQQQWQQPQQQQWQEPQSQWNAQPQWNAQNQWNPQPQAWNAPALTGPASNHLSAGGDKYPAGVNPQSCPNYPYCDVNSGGAGGAVAAPPLPGFTERLYPAGVSPHTCPNFPICN